MLRCPPWADIFSDETTEYMGIEDTRSIQKIKVIIVLSVDEFLPAETHIPTMAASSVVQSLDLLEEINEFVELLKFMLSPPSWLR